MYILYFLTLHILPLLIKSNEYFSYFINSFNSLKEKIKNDFNNLKIKHGFAKKNLILGGIKNLNWNLIKPFFSSFFDANIKNCDIIIFCKKISQEVSDKLKSLGVIMYEIPDEYNKLSVPDVRFVLYEEFLRDRWDKYNMILSTDIRDVFIQKDVFKYYEKYKSFLGLAIEDGDLTEKSNKRWLTRIYGNDIYEAIKHERVICCGTIWGTADKFYEMSYDMAKELKAKYPLNIFVHDQPVLNYFVYYLKKYKDFIIYSNNSGPVMTIGCSHRENISIDSDGNLLNYKGEIPALIHQYDRFPDILKKIKKKYGHHIDKSINGINNENNEANYFYIYFFLILMFLFFVLLIALICRCICKIFRKTAEKKSNQFKSVKIEKSKNKRKKKNSKDKWTLVLNNS